MLISLIIPTLNEEDHIGRLLRSVSNYSKDVLEIIVVVGGSTDRTIEIINEFDIIFERSSLSSRAHQMNKGARLAKGQVLYFVHADVQLVEYFIDDITSAIQRGIQSGCYRFKFDKPKSPLLFINGFFTRFPFKWCRGGDQTFFIEKKIFNDIGGYNESYVIMEDYELLDRLEDLNVSFKVLPKSVKVSARKYDHNSYLKVQLTNLKAMRMYKRGIDPQEIKAYYCMELKGRYKNVHLNLGN